MRSLVNKCVGARGFTLIETLMVIIVIGIIGAGILMYFAGAAGSGDIVMLNQGAALASERMERVHADRKANGFSTIVPEPSVPLAAPFGRFSRSVEVYCVQEADLDTQSGTMPSCSDSDIKAKRVRVIVTWPGGSLDMSTVITDS